MKGFTLLEILIVIAIIGLLAAISFPIYASVREKSRAATCTSNLRQHIMAMKLYVQDNDETWPTVEDWAQWTLKGGTFPRCPSVRLPTSMRLASLGHVPGYAFNTAFVEKPNHPPVKNSDIVFPATTVALCEQAATQEVAYGPNPYKDWEDSPPLLFKDWERHQGGANYAFCDGHVKWYRPEAVGYRAVAPNDGVHPTFEMSATRDKDGHL